LHSSLPPLHGQWTLDHSTHPSHRPTRPAPTLPPAPQWTLDHSTDTRFDQLQPLTADFGFNAIPLWFPLVVTQQAPPVLGGGWLVRVTMESGQMQQLREALPALA